MNLDRKPSAMALLSYLQMSYGHTLRPDFLGWLLLNWHYLPMFAR